MPPQKEGHVLPRERTATTYKHEIVLKLGDLQRTVREAPVDVDMPIDSICGLLMAVVELINCTPERNKVEAERRMLVEINDALVPLGFCANYSAYTQG